MKESTAEAISKIIGTIFGAVILAPLALALIASIGYLIGLIVAWAVGGFLTGILGITAANIPIIIAWLFVVSSILGLTARSN